MEREAAERLLGVVADDRKRELFDVVEVAHDWPELVRLDVRAALPDEHLVRSDRVPVAVDGHGNAPDRLDDLVRWTGVTEALTDMIERPDFIHALMRRLTDFLLSRNEQLERLGLLTESNTKSRIGSGAAGYTSELPASCDCAADTGAPAGFRRQRDQWGGATAQIFSSVSPEMHNEFALSYEKEIMARCGLNYYGCCEPLHDKMERLATVPRLRKLSISPWCDTRLAAERATRRYVFSHKPSPAIMADESFDAARAEADLRARLRDSGEMPCEIILKDISTVRGDVRRLVDWCRLAHSLCLERAQ